MVSRTLYVCRLASTVSGLRRILKKPGSVINYIKKGVETGVYRTSEELIDCAKARIEADDLKAVMKRFRQDIVRGSNIVDYPTEYVILKQHPPIPDPPRTPAKLMRKLQREEQEQQRLKNKNSKNKRTPIDKLVRVYMDRYDDDRFTSSSKQGKKKPSMSSAQYYERLLGVQASKAKLGSYTSEVLVNKSASVQQAYNAAVLHYQLQTTSGTVLSDAECMKKVDEILRSQLVSEYTFSTEQKQKATEFQQKKKQLQRDFVSENAKDKKMDGKPNSGAGKDSMEDHPLAFLQRNRATMEAMMIWSDRLRAVPYKEWTIGASTALDHWIARQVLKISEETWQSCLEGLSSSPFFLSIGRNIVATREALFPETVLQGKPIDEVREMKAELQEEAQAEARKYEDDDEEGSEMDASAEKSIEELLESLGGSRQSNRPEDQKETLRKPTSSSDSRWDWLYDASELEGKGLTKQELGVEVSVVRLVSELQDWRRKAQKQPYETWPREPKAEFDIWLKQYVETVLLAGSNVSGSNAVDFEATREALLSQPPIDKEESDAFWGSLTEPQLAAELLKRINKNKGDDLDFIPLSSDVLDVSNVWNDLNETEQIERLLNLGAIRPLLDEYTIDSDRTEFLQRHGHQLLQDVKLEHLVPDPEGPITRDDLPSDIVAALNVQLNDRFSLQIKRYNSLTTTSGGSKTYKQDDDISSSDEDDVVLSADEKSRLLFVAWNQQKAGRARYEEHMFQTGRLGLRYNDPLPKHNAYDKYFDIGDYDKKRK